jgi:hypothetical protein
MATKTPMMRLQLDNEAKARLDMVCKRRGMTQIALMTRLVNWFIQQDDYILTEVLRTLSDGSMASLAKSRLRTLSRLKTLDELSALDQELGFGSQG